MASAGFIRRRREPILNSEEERNVTLKVTLRKKGKVLFALDYAGVHDGRGPQRAIQHFTPLLLYIDLH